VETGLDYLAHLTRESARFAEAIAAAAPDAPVPSCPDWTADDLLWHLAWVQSWWAAIVRDNLTGPDAALLQPERPPDRAGLLELYLRASRDLPQILGTVAADTPAWTWSDDHTVGFIRRKGAGAGAYHRQRRRSRLLALAPTASMADSPVGEWRRPGRLRGGNRVRHRLTLPCGSLVA
jgi:hypothetical protein